jgi:hypothetical protein
MPPKTKSNRSRLNNLKDFLKTKPEDPKNDCSSENEDSSDSDEDFDQDFEMDESPGYADIDTIAELVEFCLDSQTTKRSLSILVFAILR